MLTVLTWMCVIILGLLAFIPACVVIYLIFWIAFYIATLAITFLAGLVHAGYILFSRALQKDRDAEHG